MQDIKGKTACKSEEITATPTHASSAEVTPCPMANERVQAQAKKAKKKGLEGYFGAGARMPPPTLKGTPIYAARKRRGGEETTSGRNKGDGGSSAVPRMEASSNIGGEGKQRGSRAKTTKPSKKSPCNALDNDLSRQSKKTQSDDKVSSPDKSGRNTVNLESIKGSLRKKGSGTPSPKGLEKMDKKKATFAEVARKPVMQTPAPAIKHKKCVVAFSVRVDKGKDTQAAFCKKLISAPSFLQAHIDKHTSFFAIDESDSRRPPIREKADLPIYQVILHRYFAILNERAFDNVNQEGGRAIRGSAVVGGYIIA
jgi:hypothetical protein